MWSEQCLLMMLILISDYCISYIIRQEKWRKPSDRRDIHVNVEDRQFKFQFTPIKIVYGFINLGLNMVYRHLCYFNIRWSISCLPYESIL